MKVSCVSRWMAWTIVVVLLCFSSPAAIAKEEQDARGILDSLKESYDDLPEAGKFATGAVAGFGVTRFTVNKVVGVIKLAGAAFIASEALKYSGALERVSEENMDMAQKIKSSVVKSIDKYREGVRNRLKPESLRQAFNDAKEKDKMATMGFATGCFVGCVL